MRLIESSVEIIPQEAGLEGIYRQIERAGRLCYKSEDKICEGSAEKMVNFLKDRGHYSPLEHGTVYLYVFFPDVEEELIVYKQRYYRNPYTKVVYKVTEDGHHLYITTNMRVLVENNWLDDLQYLCEPTEHHEKRVTVKMNCSIGISREFNRHRVNSICEQSTRYCNYSKDKFGNELTFVIPEWIKDIMNDIASSIDWVTGQTQDYILQMPMAETVSKYGPIMSRAVNCWIDSMKKSEDDYMYLITQEELKPQEARSVLPLDTATEVIYTAFLSDWKHFLQLRKAVGAHPDARILANQLEFILLQNGLLH